jgi:hypothetical protein
MASLLVVVCLIIPKIGFPAMVLTQWVIIGTGSILRALARGGFIEHATSSGPIYVRGMNSEADDSASVLIHHHHDPEYFQSNGLSPEKINAPQAVLCVSKSSQPRRAIVGGIWFAVDSKYARDGVVIQVKTKS